MTKKKCIYQNEDAIILSNQRAKIIIVMATFYVAVFYCFRILSVFVA